MQSDVCIDTLHLWSNVFIALLLIWKEDSLSSCKGAIVFPNSTRSQGWNRLYSELFIRYYAADMPARHRFDYIVLVDGSTKLVFSGQFETKEKQPWRVFEGYLLEYEPAIGFPVVETVQSHTKQNGRDVQGARSFHDYALALHIRATPLLLPLAERFDDNVAAMIQGVLATAVFGEQIMQINTLVISNTGQVSESDVHLKAWVRQWISSSVHDFENQIAIAGPFERASASEGLVESSLGSYPTSFRSPSPVSEGILSLFEPCHPYFYEQSQFYRELQHHVPDRMIPPADWARGVGPDDCRDLLSEDDPTISPQLSVGCNMSDISRDLAGIAERA